MVPGSSPGGPTKLKTMFYEKLPFTIDVERARYDLNHTILPLGEPVMQGAEYNSTEYHGFGGYSVLSRTGDWRDGWEMGHIAHSEARQYVYPDGIPNYRALKYLNFSHGFEHNTPTQAYVGEIQRIVEQLANNGFYPRRARISLMKAGAVTTVHQDGSIDSYMARVHIPIVTNDACIHSCEGIDLHMPADGSVYIMWVNRLHQAVNTSTQDRYHILMDVYDTNGLTENFKYAKDISILQQEADAFRQKLDVITLSPEEIVTYDAIKAQFIKK